LINAAEAKTNAENEGLITTMETALTESDIENVETMASIEASTIT